MLERVDKQLMTNQETQAEAAPKGGRTMFLTSFRVLAQIILMVGVLAGSFVAMNKLIAAKPERTARPRVDVSLPVMAIAANPADERPSISLFGEVAAAKTIDLRAPVAGEVVTISDKLVAGQLVQEGEFLFSIERFDFELALAEAEANLAQTRASIAESRARIASENEQLNIAREQLDFAQADLERAQTLRKNGTLTNKQVDDRSLILSQRQQAVSQRQNNLLIEEARLEQQIAAEQRLKLGVERASRNLADTEVKAPFSGIIRAANIEIGRIVSNNDVVLSMYGNDALDVRFTLTNAQYGRVAVDGDPLIGRAVKLTWTVGGIAYNYEATVQRIGADIATERGGVDVYARLIPADQPVQIRPGAFVEVVMPDRLYKDAIRLPETALYAGDIVYVIADGKLAARPVSIVAFDGEDVLIGGGLDAGELVMTTRLSAVDEGLAVSVPDENGEFPAPARPNRGSREAGAQAETNGAGQANGRPSADNQQRQGRGEDPNRRQNQGRENGEGAQ